MAQVYQALDSGADQCMDGIRDSGFTKYELIRYSTANAAPRMMQFSIERALRPGRCIRGRVMVDILTVRTGRSRRMFDFCQIRRANKTQRIEGHTYTSDSRCAEPLVYFRRAASSAVECMLRKPPDRCTDPSATARIRY